ncbi:cystathionine beta-lyase [Marinivivus vitaminiproducens]|uniref:cystathionine beta-lyase n=1 Tax=Marinivivus vitaminiproducens TaxID=3035935 RepID=UPI0027AB8B82|nr:cystathionine beta-lyase [Geminicoccaceae bacterium SCSIO 64248]
MDDRTKLVDAGRHPEQQKGTVNPGVYRASTILFPNVAEFERPRAYPDVGYGRYGTSTAFNLQEAVQALEGGGQCLTVSSGKAAIVQALLALVEPGDHILVTDSAYGPTRTFADGFLKRFGVETTYYDPTIGAGIAGLIRPNTRVVFMESPGSLTFEVQDVPAMCQAARERGVVTVMDNTWATPLFFKPLAHGVDVSILAATKYIGGHSDLLMGTITTVPALADQMRARVHDMGTPAAADDCWLALRGLRTLAVRLAQHQAGAIAMAEWLAARPEVARVMHPALPDDPGHALWSRDFTGASGLFGIRLKPFGKPALTAMLDGLELFGMGFSWGGYESLIIPSRLARLRTVTPWPEGGPTLRLHIGLEAIDDLKADLAAGFERLKAAA